MIFFEYLILANLIVIVYTVKDSEMIISKNKDGKHKTIEFADKTLLKFLFVGMANTLVGCGIMFLFYNFLGVSYWLSSMCNYIVGGALSYFLNKYFTFQNKKKSLLQIGIFIINLILCYFISYSLSQKAIFLLLSSELSEKKCGNIALGVGLCIYTCLNYLGQRLVVFKE